MIEVGRICVKTAGREAGKICCIIKKVDATFVMITGPRDLTHVKRRKCNLAHLEPLKEKVKIKEDASESDVLNAYKEADLYTKLNIEPIDKEELAKIRAKREEKAKARKIREDKEKKEQEALKKKVDEEKAKKEAELKKLKEKKEIKKELKEKKKEEKEHKHEKKDSHKEHSHKEHGHKEHKAHEKKEHKK